MKNSVLILGQSFIVRLRKFVHGADHSKVDLNLNLSKRVIYRGYSGWTIVRIAVRGLREVDSLKPTLVCLQIGSNDLCNLDIQVEVWVDKIVSFALELRGHGVRRVCVHQILHRKPPSKAGRFMVDSAWFNNRVDLTNKLLNDRLGRNFQSGIKFWRNSGSGHQKIKVGCTVRKVCN